ncbi:SDR family NAD(P)-dependent oxidoreductase [Actinokineospora guangxiensis]|uniref:SDR family NAD(P)-dependent oxidoreductase n=1 Tax=Actinokineospora guangxiensis TaxID=1490288 RepID=A0ABW0ESK8_9PSEU
MTGAGPSGIAVVGMAGRFPGAASVDEFWANLVAGAESISRVDRDPAEPAHVPAEGLLDGQDRFDAEFFGYSPREAETMDPQHRVCLEAVWSAFDSAGFDPAAAPGPVGVFLSASISSYLIRNLLPDRNRLALLGGFPVLIHNDKDFLPTTVSHKLGLTGPSLAVGTACSSSLVAVHLACQSLLAFESDTAVAGGVSLQVPQGRGHVHRADGIYSADGHCRAFGEGADGTVGGSGVGVVVLRRLEDALRDGDPVHAVILGSAVNNDGSAKAGYTAPGVDGQAAVVAEALAVAGCSAAEVGYVEAHGTGTPLGDAIEVEALTRAYAGVRPAQCAIGSVKTNIGHLDAAAGVAGLIKAVLAVEHGVVPASLHCDPPNPAIDFVKTPFRPARSTRPWGLGGVRTAGVSAFGIGGTNAHVVIRSAPDRPMPSRARRWLPVLVSGRDADTADAFRHSLARHLRADADLSAVAATTAGQRALPARAAVVAETSEEAADLVAAAVTRTAEQRPVVFAFPGQGAWSARAAAALYVEEPTWRGHVDTCLHLLDSAGRGSPRSVFDASIDVDTGDPAVGQVALFIVEFATAATLCDWGVEPVAVVGHSLGEYAAAVVAGALSLTDALAMTAARGELFAELPAGAMLAVAGQVRDGLPDGLDLSAVNSEDQHVIAGDPTKVASYATDLVARGVWCRPLPATKAYHSAAVDAITARFDVPAVGPPALTVPFASTVLGGWASAHDLGAEYWVRHLRATVRFADALSTILSRHPDAVVLELGFGDVLTSLVRRTGHSRTHRAAAALPVSRPARGLLHTVADLWAEGHDVDWSAVVSARRTRLPDRPLRRDRFWVDPPGAPVEDERTLAALTSGIPMTEPPPLPDDLRFRSAMDRLCAAGALRFLEEAGVDTAPGARHTVAGLAADIDVLPPLRRMLDFLLDTLAEDGIARRSGGELEFRPGRRPRLEEVAAELLEDYPGKAELVELVRRCVEGYRRALSEPGSALALLYPGGRANAAAGVTVGLDAVGARIAELGKIARRLADRAGRPLRVLEVGAGEGRLTEALAPGLVALGADYLATDISRAFTVRLDSAAAERGVPLRTAVLDITADPAPQGIEPGSFDLVVALDVVHATPDVRATLRRLLPLLNRTGVLGVIETAARDRWLSMVWGLTEGWWTFRDDRQRTPLLDAGRWRRVAAEVDAAEHTVLPAAADACLVLLRRRPPADTLDDLVRRLPRKEPDVADWAYVPTWRRLPPVSAPSTPPGRCVVFAAGSAGDAVAAELRARGAHVTVVRPRGEVDVAPDEIAIDPREPTAHAELLQRIGPVDAVVHLWAADIERAGPLDPHSASAAQAHGLHSVLGLVRALGAAKADARPRRLLVVTAESADVLGGELDRPEHATLHAAVRVIPREYPWLLCSAIDLPAALPSFAAVVVAEALADPADSVVAYRGDHRWAPGFEQTRLPEATTHDGGVYLVCGGLGGIGLALAEHLAALPATVIVTTRRPVESVGGDLADRLARASSGGGRIIVERADITDRDRMRDLVRDAVGRWGPLAGVVHAAGVHDDAGMIQRRSAEDTDAVIAAKVIGTTALVDALAGHRPRFVLLCSSIGTALPNLKFGEVGYLAAHEFSNAFAAHAAARTDLPVVAVGWTDWLDSGMWARARRSLVDRASGHHADVLGADLLRGLTDTEGVEVFDRVTSAPPGPHVLISTQRLPGLLAVHDAYAGAAHHAVSGDLLARPSHRDRAPRGVAPLRSDGERVVAAIWRDLLGVAEIGPDDDFFALGGDSLLALRFLTLLRERTGADHPIARLFEAPTVADIARSIAARGGTPTDLLL